MLVTSCSLFQSSSDLQAGCNLDRDFCPTGSILEFQSSSDLQAGCNHGHNISVGNLGVSILIRPSGRMQPGTGCCAPSSPAFQSSSDLQAGCNRWLYDKAKAIFYVSTLIRPSGRMQPVVKGVPHRICGFQPSSDLQAGCNPCERRSPPPEPRCFNPHPTFRPDATRCRKRTPTTSTRFQPSSDLQAGCNPCAWFSYWLIANLLNHAA